MFSKKELKIINNALIIIYLLSVDPTFIFGFTKSNDFTSTFFLIANIILVCLFIIIAIRIAKIQFQAKDTILSTRLHHSYFNNRTSLPWTDIK